jgi:hypothetical protein
MEQVIGFLTGVTGHTFDILYDLHFTEERVIAVLIQHPADVPNTVSWPSIYIFGNWSSKRKEQTERGELTRERRRDTRNMTPTELLTMRRNNFEIRYSAVTSVEIKKQLFQTQLRFHLAEPSGDRYTRAFGLPKDQIPEARRLLELVLKDKIKGA